MKYRAKPVLIVAEQVSRRCFDDTDDEAIRIRRALGISDGLRLYGGGLQGHLEVEDGQDAGVGNWIVLLPDGGLRVFSDRIFRVLFALADDEQFRL